MMPNLPEKADLAELQRYVFELEQERGFSGQNALEKCLLLGEELGELFKAVRKQQGLPIEKSGTTLSVADELADMLIYLCAIANRYEIDMDATFRAKEERNTRRRWEPA